MTQQAISARVRALADEITERDPATAESVRVLAWAVAMGHEREVSELLNRWLAWKTGETRAPVGS